MTQPSANSSLSARGLRWSLPLIKPSARRSIGALGMADPEVVNLLAQRQFSPDQARTFLDPGSFTDFMKHTFPALCGLKDVEQAATKLADAIEKGEPIGISGDYDCDGNCSVALMCRFLMQSGLPAHKIHVHIPNRELEGYGINEKAVDAMLDANIKLLLTLDNGTSAYGPITKAARSGLPVIVADHHGNHAADGLPNALIINPNRNDESSTLSGVRDMAAVGVTFLLCTRAAQILEKRGHYQRQPEPALRKGPNPRDWLGLVAMATVGDVVNIATPINRMFITEGLEIIRQDRDPYIKALAESAQVPFPISEESIAFSLAPIVNAPGRLGQSIAWTFLSGMAGADKAGEKQRRRQLFQGLAEVDQGRSNLNPRHKAHFTEALPKGDADYSTQEHAALDRQQLKLEKLEQQFGSKPELREARLLMLLSKQCNEERKALESELLHEARAQAKQWLSAHPDSGTVVVAGQGWHPGLIGVVAGRLKEELNLPVIVGSINEEGTGFKCSARSIKSPDEPKDGPKRPADKIVHIGQAFYQLKDSGSFDKAGGHQMASGGSFEVRDAAQMQPRINQLREGFEQLLGDAARKARDAWRLEVSSLLDLKGWQQKYGKKSMPELCNTIHAIDDAMRPYGQGNTRPVFAIANAYITNISRSRDGKHLFFDVQQPGCDITLEAVAFHVGGTPLEKALLQGRNTPIHVAGTLSLRDASDGQSSPTLQLRLEDACLAQGPQQTISCLQTQAKSATDRAGILVTPTPRARA